MNFGINPFDIAFFLLAPTIAMVATRVQKRSHVFIALALASLCGWGLAFGASAWIDAQWTSLMDRTPNPSEQLIQQFDTDGGDKAALLLFGLPISFAYASTWFGVVLGIYRFLRRRSHA
jgi:TRAP-type C4-dicarboxylate transport system permease small subunit